MIQKLKYHWLQSIVIYLYQNSRIVIMALSLLLGVLAGSILVKNESVASVLDLSVFFENFLEAREDKGMMSVVLHSFLSSLLYLMIAYCSGLFVYGAPISILLPSFRGLGIGSVCGYIYLTFGLKGTAFAMLIIIPAAFLNGLVLLVACRESFKFSVSMAAYYIKNNSQICASTTFKKYNLRYLILLLFTFAISIMDGLLSGIFINVFGF